MRILIYGINSKETPGQVTWMVAYKAGLRHEEIIREGRSLRNDRSDLVIEASACGVLQLR